MYGQVSMFCGPHPRHEPRRFQSATAVYWHAVIAIGQSIQLHGYVYKYTDKTDRHKRFCVSYAMKVNIQKYDRWTLPKCYVSVICVQKRLERGSKSMKGLS